jgi:hypothetical protein
MRRSKPGNNTWLLSFNGTNELWQDITAEEGDYEIAVSAIGEYNISLGEENFVMHSSGMNLNYAGSVHLGNGTTKLKLDSADALQVGTVLIYPAAAGQNVLGGGPTAARITGFSRASETRADVSVNATRPFTLSFAETYDPLWEAYVYRDGKLMETVDPVPLYGTMNGYWIETTGDGVDVELRYTPQDTFETGRAVSLLVLTLCLGALAYFIALPENERGSLAARTVSGGSAGTGPSPPAVAWLLPAVPIMISHFAFADAYVPSLLLCAALVPFYACLRKLDAGDTIKYSLALLLLGLAALPLYGEPTANVFAGYSFFLLFAGGAALVIEVLRPLPGTTARRRQL